MKPSTAAIAAMVVSACARPPRDRVAPAPPPARNTAPGITRCPLDLPDAATGREALTSLGDAIASSAGETDRDRLFTLFREVLEMRCFALAAENPRPPRFASAASLRTWWRDGGDMWLASFVEARDREGLSFRREVILPPDTRRLLASDLTPAHPLAALLCPSYDADCGTETRGWLRRAERAITGYLSARWMDPEEDIGEICTKKAQRSYDAWRNCLERESDRRLRLPFGQFREPTEGWLVVMGRTGHWEFCDEIRAVSLATGATYVARECTTLELGDADRFGGVDEEATDEGRIAFHRSGRIPVAWAREAALVTMIAPEFTTGLPRAQPTSLPRGMRRVWSGAPIPPPPPPTRLIIDGGDRHAWLWLREGRIEANGTLRSWEPAEQHAMSLWEWARASMRETCPPEPLPERLPLGREDALVPTIDASRASQRSTRARLAAALIALPAPPCDRSP